MNDSRMELFAQEGRAIESIPPTKAALVEHTKRVISQSGCVWGKELCLCSFLAQQILDTWTRGSSNKWESVWTSLPEASSSCQELI